MCVCACVIVCMCVCVCGHVKQHILSVIERTYYNT